MKKNLLFIILSVLAGYAHGQNAVQIKIDSLLSQLKTEKEDTSKVNTLNALALASRLHNPDTANFFVDKALQLASKLNFEKGMADARSYKGLILSNLGDYDQGLKNCQEAIQSYDHLLTIVNKAASFQILNQKSFAYNSMGILYLMKGNFPEALKSLLAALKNRGETGDKKEIAEIQNNLGILYMLQANYTEAITHYTISLKLREEIGDKKGIADSYNNIGITYENQHNYPEAIKNYLKTLQIATEMKDKDGMATAYLNIGIIKTEQGDYKKGMEDILVSTKLSEEIGNKLKIAIAYENVGLNYTKQKNYKLASYYLNKALSLAKEMGGMDDIREFYKDLADLDSTAGNYRKSLEHYKLFVAYRDSLFNEENTKKLVKTQMQYDFDKKESLTKFEQEKKDVIAKKELQRQKLMRNGFIAGFAVVFLFAGVFFSQRNKINKGKKRSDELLLNILPADVAEELKSKGSAEARQFDEVTVMFTDFKNFTQISEKLSPAELVSEIDTFFKAFDIIIGKHNIEKIKTIGDSYMCAGGLPVRNTTNAADVVTAALEIQQFMQVYRQQSKMDNKETFEIRIGVHTGPVVAGIVGLKKFAYDIWGDTVNIASRMESSGEAGRVNISGRTYELVRDKFVCSYRGKIQAKNKGEIDMYFVESVTSPSITI